MDFSRNVRLVADGCKTPDPMTITYDGVVSRKSVRITFTYANLNNLDVWAGDVQTAYLPAPCSEKYYTVLGPEFRPEYKGRKALIIQVAYGLKNTGADFRDHLRDCMKYLGYTSCSADPDVWMQPAQKEEDIEYYDYVLLCVDDCLCVSEDPKHALVQISKYFSIKLRSLGPQRYT